MKTKNKKPFTSKIAEQPTSVFSAAEMKEMEKETVPAASPVVEEMGKSAASKPIDGEERRAFAFFEKDGKVLWERMRPSTKEQLKEFFNRKDVIDNLNLKPKEGTASTRNILSPETVKKIYMFLGWLQSMLGRMATKLPKDVVDKIMLFDDEELNMVVMPSVKMINKYGPDWLSGYNEDCEFLGAVISVIVSKIFLLRKTAVDYYRQQDSNAPPQPTRIKPDPAKDIHVAAVAPDPNQSTGTPTAENDLETQDASEDNPTVQ